MRRILLVLVLISLVVVSGCIQSSSEDNQPGSEVNQPDNLTEEEVQEDNNSEEDTVVTSTSLEGDNLFTEGDILHYEYEDGFYEDSMDGANVYVEDESGEYWNGTVEIIGDAEERREFYISKTDYDLGNIHGTEIGQMHNVLNFGYHDNLDESELQKMMNEGGTKHFERGSGRDELVLSDEFDYKGYSVRNVTLNGGMMGKVYTEPPYIYLENDEFRLKK